MYLTEEHHLIRKTVRDFAEREIRPLARELDESGEFSIGLTKKMGDIGLFGLRTPAKYGGNALDTLSYVIVIEELARVDSSQAATIAAHISLGIGPILNYGTEEQKEKYIPMLSTGEATWAFGLTEPDAGSDSRATKSSARLEEDHWIINGSKIFITNGASRINKGATVQVVSGQKNGEKEFSTILVDIEVNNFASRSSESFPENVARAMSEPLE